MVEDEIINTSSRDTALPGQREPAGYGVRVPAQPLEGMSGHDEREQITEKEPQAMVEDEIHNTSGQDTSPLGDQETPDRGAEGSAEPAEGRAEPNEEETPPPRSAARSRARQPRRRSASGRFVAEEVEAAGRSGERAQRAEQAGQQGAPVTEKPVVTRRKISQYVVSVDDSTGNITKIEKLDEATGQREEFTREEYAEAYAYASYAAPYYGQYAASLQEPSYNPWGNPATQAYLKAITDYFREFTTQA